MLLCSMTKVLKNKRNPDAVTGIFMLLAGFSIIAAFLTKFEFIGIITNFTEDFEYLADSRMVIRINSILWILSAILTTFLSASLFSSMKIYKNPSKYYTGFFFLLTAMMFFIAGIKGWGLIETLVYQETKVINLIENEYIKASIISLEKEKDLYIRISTVLIGFVLISLGLFSMKTRRIPLFYGIIFLITGLSLPVLALFMPGSPFYDIAVIIALLILMSFSFRLFFHGFVRKKKMSGKT